jgi:hypothetical protein
MITNKYESPPGYQHLKQQRLRQIQEDYFPPPPKSCFKRLLSNPPVYTNTAEYILSFESRQQLYENFQLKHSVTYNRTSLIFLLVFLSYAICISLHSKETGFSILLLLFVMLPPLKNCIRSIADKTPQLTITKCEIRFEKKALFIPWQFVIATHILEERGEDTRYSLVVDYYDTVEGYSKTEKLLICGYDHDCKAIAVAVEMRKPPQGCTTNMIIEKNSEL